MAVHPDKARDEFRDAVKALHAAGIEVILDVVLNHSAESDLDGPTLSMRGIDNRSYYWIREDGDYHNWTGCGNTLNLSHPAVTHFAYECLKYWVETRFHPIFQAFIRKMRHRRMAEVERVTATGPVVVITILSDPIIATVINSAHGERRTVEIAFRAVVQHHVQNHFDTGRMKRFHRITKLVPRLVRVDGHPAVTHFAYECLKYWVETFHVDGFRFDLAPVMGRTPGFSQQAPLFEAIKNCGPSPAPGQNENRRRGTFPPNISGIHTQNASPPDG